ncbi:MAG TPA: hypothetical protein VG244_04755 [Acidimicrobiales bacterium]|nr:hypothetical protein [Acidimicrobiales bacterium]
MTATTTTTIQGVSVHSRQKKRGADVFELALSPAGIEVRRPGRPVQQMSWNRVSEWEIEERKGYVLLTLRGRDAATPLMVPGWSLDDLEILMRGLTSDAMSSDAEEPGPATALGDATTGGNGASHAAVAETAAPARPKTRPKPKSVRPAAAPTAPAAAAAATAAPAALPASKGPPPPSRAERRAQRRSIGVQWKVMATVALLGLLATAVTLVLLQSAGIISWGFLGPVA